MSPTQQTSNLSPQARAVHVKKLIACIICPQEEEKMEKEKGKEGGRARKVDNTWKVSDTNTETKAWKELPEKRKIRRIMWNYSLRYVVLLVLLYLTLCALDLLGSSFRLFGGYAMFTGGMKGWPSWYDRVIENPLACLCMGILGTALIQSSSVTTVITAKMAADKLLPIQAGVCVVIGANVGTTITPAIASLTHFTDRKKFARAFGGAALHTLFNFLTALIMFPLEAASGMMYHVTRLLVKSYSDNSGHEIRDDPLHIITQPFNQFIIQLNEPAISDNRRNVSLVRDLCNVTVTKPVEDYYYITKVIDGVRHSFERVRYKDERVNTIGKCRFLFGPYANSWPDWSISIALFILAMAVFWVCILLAVVILRQIVRGHRTGRACVVLSTTTLQTASCITGFFYFVLGLAVTLLLQSSSIIVIIAIVFLGRGITSIQRVYIIIVSTNLGTTFTLLFSSMATGSKMELQLALCHLLFNFVGFVLWFLVPLLRTLPVYLAKRLGNTVRRFRWYSVFHILFSFVIFPLILFLLCLADWIVLVAVLIPFIILVIIIVTINVIQCHKPTLLPASLTNWDFLPKWMHSLKPYDKGFSFCFRACKDLGCCGHKKRRQEKINKRVRSMELWQNSRVKLYFSDYSNTGTLRSVATSRDTLRSNLGAGNSRDTLRSNAGTIHSRDTLRSYDQTDSFHPPSNSPRPSQAPLAKIESEDDEVFTITEGNHTVV